jgi:hypothetical protein
MGIITIIGTVGIITAIIIVGSHHHLVNMMRIVMIIIISSISIIIIIIIIIFILVVIPPDFTPESSSTFSKPPNFSIASGEVCTSSEGTSCSNTSSIRDSIGKNRHRQHHGQSQLQQLRGKDVGCKVLV